MAKRSFRRHAGTNGSGASYPSWSEVAGRREFLAAMGAAVLAGCVDADDAEKEPQPRKDVQPNKDAAPPVDLGVAPDINVTPPDLAIPDDNPGWPDIWPDQHPPWVAGDLIPPQDMYKPDLVGKPDAPKPPKDLWPRFAEGLPPPPDVPWRKPKDGGGQ